MNVTRETHLPELAALYLFQMFHSFFNLFPKLSIDAEPSQHLLFCVNVGHAAKTDLSFNTGSVEIELIPWAGRTYDQPILTQHTQFTMNALGSKVVKTLALKPLLTNESNSLKDVIVRVTATARGNPQGGFP